MIESQLKFEDEEKIQQKNEWYVCHMGMFGGGGSTRFDPDRVRNLPAFGSVGQMGNTPVPGQREVRVGRDLYEFQGGGRDGAGGYQFVGSMPEETFQAIQPKPKPQPAPKTQERPQPVAQAAAPRPVQPQMSTPSGSQASDMNSYIDEIQARYDMQITEMKNLIDAGNLAREQQLQDLTTKTQERKERVKKPRKYGRRSLLTGSELGVQNETLGG